MKMVTFSTFCLLIPVLQDAGGDYAAAAADLITGDPLRISDPLPVMQKSHKDETSWLFVSTGIPPSVIFGTAHQAR